MWQLLSTLLVKFDAVEVVDLKGALGNEAREYLAGTRPTKRVRLEGEPAARIGELLCSLPADEQMRCHIPPFGLVFWNQSVEICRVSICWQCNNISGVAGDQPLAYQFDASSKAARQLLNCCKQAMASGS